jgi:hypothetical protein
VKARHVSLDDFALDPRRQMASVRPDRGESIEQEIAEDHHPFEFYLAVLLERSQKISGWDCMRLSFGFSTGVAQSDTERVVVGGTVHRAAGCRLCRYGDHVESHQG